MEENLIIENNPIEQPKRPQFLTVLCVLSFIWSGFLVLCLFLCLCFSKFIFSSIEMLQKGGPGVPTMGEAQLQGMQILLDLGPQKFMLTVAIAIIVYMTSLLGVVKMWKMQKVGFYIYAGVNSLGLAYDLASGSYVMIVITLAFLGMYFSNFKYLR